MRTVFVLIYAPESIAESSRSRGTVYSVFEDRETAEAMKRTGDTVAEVPFFETEKSRKVNESQIDFLGLPAGGRGQGQPCTYVDCERMRGEK